MGLVMQHMNYLANTLMQMPQYFEALFNERFNENAQSDEQILIAEEWCFGYMRGVDLDDWTSLPVELETWLYAIELHGREHNFELRKTLTLDEHQKTVTDIEPAVRKLHAYWLSQRAPEYESEQKLIPSPIRTEPKVGRNECCPCGSGKKFKKCCLH
jgi:uncharacterized protein